MNPFDLSLYVAILRDTFLFGNLRGYCVHFAHSAVHLLRSQGVAARVALGYAVDLRNRGEGSSLLIMANTAHAWPEIHVAGIGWIPFDIYPEQSDEPPPGLVQQSLESLLGELARDDEMNTAFNRQAKQNWTLMLERMMRMLAMAFVLCLLCLYGTALGRRFYLSRSTANGRQRFRLVLDGLSNLGYRRLPNETREEFSNRMQMFCPSLKQMTRYYQGYVYGDPTEQDCENLVKAHARINEELRRSLPLYRRGLGLLNPIGWLRTR